MKQNTYCLVSQIPKLDPLHYVLRTLRNRLTTNEIPHRIPKLKWHITHVSPFLATSLEMWWLAIGLEIGKAMMADSNPYRLVKSTTLDFFRNKDMDALVLHLHIDTDFQGIIERVRAKVEEKTDTKFPPESFLVNFHVTIAEGSELYKDMEAYGGIASLFEDTRTAVATNLTYPTIQVKKNGYWAPVVA